MASISVSEEKCTILAEHQLILTVAFKRNLALSQSVIWLFITDYDGHIQTNVISNLLNSKKFLQENRGIFFSN